jgi:hypothetical protein
MELVAPHHGDRRTWLCASLRGRPRRRPVSLHRVPPRTWSSCRGLPQAMSASEAVDRIDVHVSRWGSCRQQGDPRRTRATGSPTADGRSAPFSDGTIRGRRDYGSFAFDKPTEQSLNAANGSPTVDGSPCISRWMDSRAAICTSTPLRDGKRPRQPPSRISVVSDQGLIPNPGPRSDVRTPDTRQHCQHDRGTRTDPAVRRNVFVRSPRRGGLTRVLTSMGATVLTESEHGLSVTGMDAPEIASAAAAHYIPIQELTPRSTLPEGAHLEISQAR